MISHRNSTTLDLMNTTLKVLILFQKKYKEQFVATLNVDIVKCMAASDFLTGITALSSYQDITAEKLMLHRKGFSVGVESMYVDDGRSETPGICKSDVVRSYARKR